MFRQGSLFLGSEDRSIMKKLFVGSLPPEATQESVKEMFQEYGTVHSIEVIQDIFTGKCKGFAYVEMEGHEARAAIAGLDRKMVGSKSLKVKFEDPKKKGRGRR